MLAGQVVQRATRTDLFLINDDTFNSLFIDQYDGAGIASGPEPFSRALMIGDFWLIGAAGRRRPLLALATA